MKKFLVYAAVVSAVLFVCAADASANDNPRAAPSNEEITRHTLPPGHLPPTPQPGTDTNVTEKGEYKLVKVHYCPLLRKTFYKKVRVAK